MWKFSDKYWKSGISTKVWEECIWNFLKLNFQYATFEVREDLVFIKENFVSSNADIR